MRRRPYSQIQVENVSESSHGNSSLYDPSQWITSRDLAIRLGKFKKNGKPSLGAIHTMVYRKQLVGKRFFGRLLFHLNEIHRLIAASPSIGG